MVGKLRTEFMRLADISQNDESSPSRTKLIKKYVNTLHKVITSSQIMALISHSNRYRKGRKNRVQPTSIARRKDRG